MIKLVSLLVVLHLAHTWQIPHMVPKNYEKRDPIKILVGQLESRKSSLNFDFYTLNWCSNTKGEGYNPETFGTSLTGTALIEAPYEYKLDVDRSWVSCMKTLSHSEVQSFSFFMQHNYTYTLYMDDLPSATIVRDEHNRDLPPNYFEGIPIGIFSMPSRSEHKIMIYNHLDITVLVHHTIEGH